MRAETGRYGGHLFAFVDTKGLFESPELLRIPGIQRRAGETAFVLAKRGDTSFRYLGVARLDEGNDRWQIAEVDHETWRAWGDGAASRTLPEGVRASAQMAIDTLLSLAESDRWIERASGQRARITGRSTQGGLRIDGGEGGERTVSLTDLAWVVAAERDSEAQGGLLDEPRVNRLRYLDGTPKGSTRWIDTGWAVAAWERAQPWMPITLGPEALHNQGQPIDAHFLVERRDGALSVIVESRGGTKGTGDERNTAYNEGLELILARLKERGIRIADALVESTMTSRLPISERRLDLGVAYPIAINDPAALRREMGKAQAAVGRAPGAKGVGNATKRLRVLVETSSAMMEPRELQTLLRG
jgi:hypothetical protein